MTANCGVIVCTAARNPNIDFDIAYVWLFAVYKDLLTKKFPGHSKVYISLITTSFLLTNLV